jgi:hypothetical protein
MAATMEKAKALFGHLLRNVRSSNEKMASAKTGAERMINVRSDGFEPNMAIPAEYTQDGQNISPPISWAGVPAQSRELVLVVEDPDAPMINPVIHWMVYKIPAGTTALPPGVPRGTVMSAPAGARQAKNYEKIEGYSGPKPPVGHGVHHYHFQLFALDETLSLNDPTKDDLLKAMQGHVLAQGEMIGTYERVGPR